MDRRSPLPGVNQSTTSLPPSQYGDPFADSAQPISQYTDNQAAGRPGAMPQPSYGAPHARPNFLARDPYDDDDETVEKQPLTAGQNFSGGFYPPPCVIVPIYKCCCLNLHP